MCEKSLSRACPFPVPELGRLRGTLAYSRNSEVRGVMPIGRTGRGRDAKGAASGARQAQRQRGRDMALDCAWVRFAASCSPREMPVSIRLKPRALVMLKRDMTRVRW